MAEMKGEPVAARDPYSWALETGTLLSQGRMDETEFREIISDPAMAPYAAVLDAAHAKIKGLEATGDAWTNQDSFDLNAEIGAVYHKQNIPPAAPVEIKSDDNNAELDLLPQNIRDSYIALKPYFEGKPMDGTGQMYASSLALALNMYQQYDCTEAQVEIVEKEVRTALDKLLGVNTIACGQYPVDVAMRLQEIIDKQNQQNAPAPELQM